jgi:hypothetical protein
MRRVGIGLVEWPPGGQGKERSGLMPLALMHIMSPPPAPL